VVGGGLGFNERGGDCRWVHAAKTEWCLGSGVLLIAGGKNWVNRDGRNKERGFGGKGQVGGGKMSFVGRSHHWVC